MPRVRERGVIHFGLAGFRPQKLPVAIYAAPVAIDETHWLTADGTIRRRPLVDTREIRQFKIVVDHRTIFPPPLIRAVSF